MNFNFLKSIVSKLILALLNAASPAIREELDKFLTGLYAKALKTESPIDDMVVKTIADLLGVDVDE